MFYFAPLESGLLPHDLLGTVLEGLDAFEYVEARNRVEAFARDYWKRSSAIDEGTIERALLDLASVCQYGESTRAALRTVRARWRCVMWATVVEVFSLRFYRGSTDAAWDIEALRHAARILRSRRRPVGLPASHGDLFGTAIMLDRLAADTEFLAERRGKGRPAELPQLLFERLEGPFEGLGVTSADRARLCAGVLRELVGLETTSDAILAAVKSQRARDRRKAARRHR
ncbi:MAG: hypothetical protein R3F35_02425 [Myxococcota bacterium]